MKQLTPFPDFYRGDDYCLNITIGQHETPVDITGWRFISTMKLSSELPDQPEIVDGYRQVLATTMVAEGEDAKAGKVVVYFPHEKTAELLPVMYDIDLQRCYQEVVTTLVAGRVRVLADVSREVWDA